jgi:hypothetical protein
LVIFTATDDCGSTFTVATFSITDNQPPVINVTPMSLMVECDGLGNASALNQWLSNHGGAQASDACGNVIWTHTAPVMNDGCGMSGTAVVTFLATDECGHSTSATASFTIVDHVGPVINTAAHDTIVECTTMDGLVIQQWLDHHGGAYANDLCGNVSWTHNYTGLLPTCGNAGSANVTFTATR